MRNLHDYQAGDILEIGGNKYLLTEPPHWNEFWKRWYFAGHRFIRSKQKFSVNALLHNATLEEVA